LSPSVFVGVFAPQARKPSMLPLAMEIVFGRPGRPPRGFLYKITRRDLVRLEATEGVPWWRYRPVWLDAEDMSGTALHAATLTAEGDEDDYIPTLRYLTLLREGARAHFLIKICSWNLRKAHAEYWRPLPALLALL
jgi:hypothetical protein